MAARFIAVSGTALFVSVEKCDGRRQKRALTEAFAVVAAAPSCRRRGLVREHDTGAVGGEALHGASPMAYPFSDLVALMMYADWILEYDYLESQTFYLSPEQPELLRSLPSPVFGMKDSTPTDFTFLFLTGPHLQPG